jgi:hypothetical protein
MKCFIYRRQIRGMHSKFSQGNILENGDMENQHVRIVSGIVECDAVKRTELDQNWSPSAGPGNLLAVFYFQNYFYHHRVSPLQPNGSYMSHLLQ